MPVPNDEYKGDKVAAALAELETLTPSNVPHDRTATSVEGDKLPELPESKLSPAEEDKLVKALAGSEDDGSDRGSEEGKEAKEVPAAEEELAPPEGEGEGPPAEEGEKGEEGAEEGGEEPTVDELAFLKEQNARLLALLDERAASALEGPRQPVAAVVEPAPVAVPAAPAAAAAAAAAVSAPPPMPLPEGLSDEQFDAVLAGDKTPLLSYINGEVQRGRQQVLMEQEQQVVRILNTRARVAKFFTEEENRDLAAVANIVKEEATQIENQYPDKGIEEVLKLAAEGTRRRIGAVVAAQTQTQTQEEGGGQENVVRLAQARQGTARRGKFAKVTSRRIPTPKKAKPSREQETIDDIEAMAGLEFEGSL